MRKTAGDIAISSISDAHIYHPRVKTRYVLQTIDRFYPDAPITEELDYIYIAGDLFDRVRSLAEDEVYEAMAFFTYWLEMLGRRGVRLRVLEGTPSHDRNQSRLLVELNNALGENGCDLKYFETLAIDYEEDHDFHVLYVPDEWHHDSDVTWEEIVDLLRTKGLDSVQLGVMHGMFEHQLPAGIMRDHHKSNRYLSIVDWFITIGHIHSMSILDRIYAQGSPERLSHNEEEAKGIFRYLVHDSGKDNAFTAKFIPNDKATPFITIDLVGSDLEPAMGIIKKTITGHTRGYFRLLLDKKLFGDGILEMAEALTPNMEIVWSKKVEKDKTKDKEETKSLFEQNLPKLDVKTIEQHARDFALRLGGDKQLIESAMAELEKLK